MFTANEAILRVRIKADATRYTGNTKESRKNTGKSRENAGKYRENAGNVKTINITANGIKTTTKFNWIKIKIEGENFTAGKFTCP
jgi:hypothetical protein